MDIGCYPIFISRFLFGSEPLRASGVLEMDPTFGTDRLTSAVMEFRGGQSTFVCSTQLSLAQRVIVLGTKARLEVEIPYNAPTDRGCRILVDTGADLYGGGRREEILPLCDQYTIQGELFSRAILGEGSVPVPLEDSLGNMAVIEAIERSSSSGRWEPLS
jgi:predicted dehydrogenase